jgi:hypothetical protein
LSAAQASDDAVTTEAILSTSVRMGFSLRPCLSRFTVNLWLQNAAAATSGGDF